MSTLTQLRLQREQSKFNAHASNPIDVDSGTLKSQQECRSIMYSLFQMVMRILLICISNRRDLVQTY